MVPQGFYFFVEKKMSFSADFLLFEVWELFFVAVPYFAFFAISVVYLSLILTLISVV